MSRMTWSKPDGSWGVGMLNLAALPPRVYGALCKLKDMENLLEVIRDPEREDFEREQAMADLMRIGVECGETI